MTFLLLGFFVVGVFGWVTLTIVQQLDERERSMRIAAKRFGLQLTDDGEINGVVDGLRVNQWHEWDHEKDNQHPTIHTSCTFARALPPGIRLAQKGRLHHITSWVGRPTLTLGAHLDRTFVLQCPNEAEAVELFSHPDVQRLIRLNADTGQTLLVEENGLILCGFGQEIHRFGLLLQRAVSLSNALSAAMDQPWNEVAKQHGLSPTAGTEHLVGDVDGIQLSVALLTVPIRRTQVTATLNPPLPPGTHIRHPELDSRGESVGDPILDGMLSMYSEDLLALAARISTDAVRGPLLEVVRTHKGSEISADRITLVADGRLGKQLASAVTAVLELAIALRVPRETQPESLSRQRPTPKTPV